MNTFSSFEFTAFIGIDWADTKHDICIQPAGSQEREFDRIAHQPQHIEQWAHEVHQRFGGPIAVMLELSKGPIVSALQKYDFFVLFPINPLMLAKYRQAFKPSRAKDDPTDAELAVDLVLRHRDRFKPLRPQSIEMRTLVHLVEKRRRLVEDQRRFSNRLISTLKAYYPQPVEWFSHKDTFVFCAFITRWPTLNQVKRARRSTLQRFFREQRVRRPNLIEARIQAIQDATALTDDPAVINPYTLEALAEQLRTTLELIKQFDEAIAQLAPTLPDYPVLPCLALVSSSHPGSSPPSGKTGIVSTTLPRYSNTVASHPSPSAVGKSPGCIGDGNVLPLCDRPSSNGPQRPSTVHSGPAPTTSSSAKKAPLTRWPSVLWPSSGYESCIGAGNHGHPITKPSISRHFNVVVLTWSTTNRLTEGLRA